MHKIQLYLIFDVEIINVANYSVQILIIIFCITFILNSILYHTYLISIFI